MDQSRKAFGDSRLALTPEFNTFSLYQKPGGKEDNNGRRNENGSAYAYYIDLMNF